MRRVVWLGVVVTACIGCGPLSTESRSTLVTLAPSSEPTARYNEPVVPPPPSALGDELQAAVREAAVRANAPIPVPDARLFRACAEIARVVPEEGIIAYPLIEFALQHNGIIEPSPHLLVVWGDLGSPRLVVDQLRRRIASILAEGAVARIGIGAARRTADGTGAVVFALLDSGVATSPIPRSIPAGGGFTIDATVDARHRDPQVHVTRQDGTVEHLELRTSGASALSAQVQCGATAGKLQIGITATDAQGSTVLASFPVWCGATPPRSITLEPSRDDAPVTDPAAAERRIVELVNRDRQATGLPLLVWDAGVANVARDHSQEMRRTNIVALSLPTTGNVAARLRSARSEVVVQVNVARAYSVGETHQGLMSIPSTRAPLMLGSMTRMGIGVVLGEAVAGRREMFVTQVLTGPASAAVPAPVVAPGPAGPAPTADAPDEETALNAKRWTYAAYFNRLKRQIHLQWQPRPVWKSLGQARIAALGAQPRVTTVQIDLWADGTVNAVTVTASSGVPEFDAEAQRAVRAAAPFPNPPEGLVKDGHIKFNFGFNFDVTQK